MAHLKCNAGNYLNREIIIRMKLTGFFALLVFMQLSASSFSQTVTLSTKSEQLPVVFNLIREQTGYNFYTTTAC